MYGWRARIGLLVVGSDVTCESEMHNFAPEGVTCITSRMRFPGKVTPETVEKLASEAEASTELLMPARPNIVAFCCTSGSFIKGAGWDKKIIETIETKYRGIRATTTSTAVIAALEQLGIRKIAVATPYVEDVNKYLDKFLKAEGFDVVNIKGLGILEDAEVNNLPANTAYKCARDVDTAKAEGIFISCTSVPTFEVIDLIERDLGKPVVTSNQATLWDCLRKVNVSDMVKNCGKLFSLR